MHPTFLIGLSLHSCEDDKIEQSKVCEPINQQHDGLVLAGGRGERLGVLTDWRTKPQYLSAASLE